MDRQSVHSLIKTKSLPEKIEKTREFFLKIKHSMKEEELLLKQYKIPDPDFHIKIHAEFLRTIISFEDQLDEKDITQDIISTMILFIYLAMKRHEKSYGEFIQAYIRIEDFIKEMAHAG